MRIDRVRITVLSAPVAEPILMSFSQLASRDMVLVEILADGLTGRGESWVNYPSWAAKERVATLEDGLVPLLVDVDVSDPRAVHRMLEERLARLARQWGAPGPIWQAISAVDLALVGSRGEGTRRLACPVAQRHATRQGSRLRERHRPDRCRA